MSISSVLERTEQKEVVANSNAVVGAVKRGRRPKNSQVIQVKLGPLAQKFYRLKAQKKSQKKIAELMDFPNFAAASYAVLMETIGEDPLRLGKQVQERPIPTLKVQKDGSIRISPAIVAEIGLQAHEAVGYKIGKRTKSLSLFLLSDGDTAEAVSANEDDEDEDDTESDPVVPDEDEDDEDLDDDE